MGKTPLPFGMDRHLLRLDRKDLYLSLHFIMLFVRDQERSLCFYRDQLGFRVIVDQRLDTGGRWIEVAPADGSANIALAQATPGSKEFESIGGDTKIYFLTKMFMRNITNGAAEAFTFSLRPRNRPGVESSRALKM